MHKSYLNILLIVIIGIAVYSNTLHVPFVFDDEPYITENLSIQNLSNFLDISGTRYITLLTFALNYSLGGYNSFGYHLFNISVHIFNAILVYWLAALTFKTPYFKVSVIALFSGLLFVSHPIQTQAVTYISQRFTSLATFFYLASLVMYIKWRLRIEQQRSRAADQHKEKKSYYTVVLLLYCASLISAVLAMKTKEISFTLPFVIILYEFCFFSKSHDPNLKQQNVKRFLYLLPFFITIISIPLDILGPELGIHKPKIDVGEELRQFQFKELTTLSGYTYLLTQFRVIVTYIRLLFLPINQNFDYDYPIYNSFWNPNDLLSFLFLLTIFGIGLYLLYRSRFTTDDGRRTMDESSITSPPLSLVLRLISFGIFWFFITLSVESSIIPIKDVIFEHRLYLPSVGAIITFSSAIFYALQVTIHRSRFTAYASRIPLSIVYLLLSAVVIVFSIATYQRNTVWQDEISLWKDAVAGSPNKARPNYELGRAYGELGDRENAFYYMGKAAKLDPSLFNKAYY